jgi:hypothetical protein
MTNRSSISHAIKMDAYNDTSIDEDNMTVTEDRERLISSLAEAGDALEEYLKRLYKYGHYQVITKKAFGCCGDVHFTEMLALIDKKIELLRRNYSPELAEKGEQILEGYLQKKVNRF